MVETQNRRHVEVLIAALVAAGFPTHLLPSTAENGGDQAAVLGGALDQEHAAARGGLPDLQRASDIPPSGTSGGRYRRPETR